MTEDPDLGDTVWMITGAREQQLIDAASLLLDARRTHTPIADLPEELKPVDLEEVARIHEEIAVAYDEIGGWKIGAGAPDATPFFAPMPRAWMAASGAILKGPRFRYRVLEAEIAFLVGTDLPPRANPYTREEVIAAMASCHPAIEELESGLIDPKAAAHLSALADLQMHGGFIYGAAVPDWQAIDFSKEIVTLAIDGSVRVERTGSNTSGDLLRLLPYLANEGGKLDGQYAGVGGLGG
jgi:2-keto-4-pentenoate hydratase